MSERGGGVSDSAPSRFTVQLRSHLVLFNSTFKVALLIISALGDDWRAAGRDKNDGFFCCPVCQIKRRVEGRPPAYCYGDVEPGRTKHRGTDLKMRPWTGVSHHEPD
jgi:hypothetical protein